MPTLLPPTSVPEDDLGVVVRVFDGRAFVALSGELDLATAPMLATRLEALGRDVSALEVDLADLAFIDCQGIEVLLDAAGHLGGGGAVILRAPSTILRQILALLRLEEALPIVA